MVGADSDVFKSAHPTMHAVARKIEGEFRRPQRREKCDTASWRNAARAGTVHPSKGALKVVRDTVLALHALHEVLVAARNIALEEHRMSDVADIVDVVEAIPLWIADENADYTEVIIRLLHELSVDYPECGMAAATALRMRR